MVLSYAQEKWGMEISSNEELVNAFWRAWEVNLNKLCSEVEACPGAYELVDALAAARIPMAIATSSRLDSVNKKRVK